MEARWPNAFFLSTLLHGGVIAGALWLGYVMVEPLRQTRPLVFVAPGTSVAGPSVPDNFAGASAVRFQPPKVARVQPVSPVVEESGDAPVETPKPVAKPSRSARVPSSVTATRNAAPASTSQSSRTVKSPRPASPAVAPAPASVRIQHIDTTEIASGLLRGSDAHAGAGEQGAVQEESLAYLARLERALRLALEQETGLDDGLRAEVEFRIGQDGRLSAVRLVKPSGDERFDAAILKVVPALVLSPRPAAVAEVQRIPISTRAKN